MIGLIIGFGEVGRAHWENLKDTYKDSLYYKDKEETIYNTKGFPVGDFVEPLDVMMIATQCDPKDMEPFIKMVCDYDQNFCPKHIDILTTTPPGTCEEIQKRLGGVVKVTRSTIRGSHPNLSKFKCIPKHIGGPGAEILKGYYEKAGWECVLEETAITCELQHICNNIQYGLTCIATDEIYKIFRAYGADFTRYMAYGITNNKGFKAAGHPSKVRPILYPSGGKIGGHCVQYATTTLDESVIGPMIKILKNYGKT